MVVLDETHDDITVDDLREELPGHQPRYIVYSYKMEHEDKRVSYPICFIFYTPRDSQVWRTGIIIKLIRVGCRVFYYRYRLWFAVVCCGKLKMLIILINYYQVGVPCGQVVFQGRERWGKFKADKS